MARTDSLWETDEPGTYIKTIAPAGYDILINGTNKYLNFNTLSGASGYGIRDNAGTMEFKNSAGAWVPFAGSGGGTVLGVTGNSPIVVNNTDPANPIVTIQVATAAQNGYLSSTDWSTFNGKQAALGFTPENVANKATSFGTVNDTLYPTVQAAKTYIDSLVVGLLDYRGAYDASVNTFPASGGSGTAGAVLKGDMWIISVAGTLGGTAVQIGDSIIANVDTPGQTAGNWNTLNGNISYVPENVTNKVTSISGASTDTQYPSAKLLYDQLATKQATLISATNIKTINSTSLLGSGDIAVQAVLVSGTSIKTINGSSLLGSGDIVIGGSAAWGAITGTLSSQTDLQTALDAKVAATRTITVAGTANQITSSAGAQDLSANRTWTLSLPADVLIPTVLTVPNSGLHLLDTDASHDLVIKPGSNLSADRILTITTGDAARTLTLTGDTSLTGTNTGDQTSIVGITGTKAQFDTAVTDGNFLYVGDITQYTDEMAQDAVGAMVDSTLVYADATPSLGINLNTANTWVGAQSGPINAYGSGWNGSAKYATEDAIYDKIESMSSTPPFVWQDIPLQTGTSTFQSSSFAIGGDSANSVYFFCYALSSATTTLVINRMKKDALTGNFYITHTTTLTYTASSACGIAVIGSFVYVSCQIAGADALRRYAVADLSGVTTFSFSGTGRSGNCWSDGKDLYIHELTDQYDKFTLSGTTATNAATVSYTSAGGSLRACADSSNMYVVNVVSSPFQPGSTVTFNKYAKAGGSATGTTTPVVMGFTAYNGYQNINTDLFMASSTQLGIAFPFTIESNSAVKGQFLRLMAITLP